jgi:hypothetical protein
MPRLHLFEWEDQPWLPKVFRDFITDHLRLAQSSKVRLPMNRDIAERLAKLLEHSGGRRIIDLCSGAGGPLLKVHRILEQDLGVEAEVVLTDLYPNVEAFKRREAQASRVSARYESTSAFDVPQELSGVRTLFTALHHFRPEGARKILTDAVRKHQAIAVFEPQERTLSSLAAVTIMVFQLSFLYTPRVGPLTPQRFFFTYIIPLAPLIFLWDGIVSCLRTYSTQELREVINEVGSDQYDWEVGRFEHSGPFGLPLTTIYLLGKPIDAQQPDAPDRQQPASPPVAGR